MSPGHPATPGPEAVAGLLAAAARIDEFPATLVLRSLLDGGCAHGVVLVAHIVAGWADRLEGNIADFPSASTVGLQSIRARMVAELEALQALHAELQRVHAAVAA